VDSNHPSPSFCFIFLIVKKNVKSLLVVLRFRKNGPACWALQMGWPVRLCGLVWDLGSC
jgi:hypothetical protein